MLHDLLLSLLCVQENGTEENGVYSLRAKRFLHPVEDDGIDKILKIGDKYREVNRYVETRLDSHVEESLYVNAFCKGLSTVLDQYRKNVIRLEDELMINSQLSLSYIHFKLNNYESLFQLLLMIIIKIKKTQTRGCLLIGALDVFLCSGDPNLDAISISMLKPVNEIFYRHLADWIIYGIIHDPCKEFFICDSNSPDEFFQCTNISKSNKPSLVRRFYIKEDLLPSVINTSTANLILLIGRMVWIMKNRPKDRLTSCDDIWGGKELEYYHKIKNLENDTFSLTNIQATLDECKAKLSKSLCAMFDKANLMDHFQMVRDYYTLSRGDLFQQFMEIYMINPVYENLDVINMEFSDTATALYTDKDKSHKRFQLMFGKDLQNCNVLNLNFNAEWPLHIIFHPKALEAYNKLFAYLLRLKKANVNLCKLWFLHKKQREVNRNLFILRHNWKIFVDRMEYYLQVDVIEASFFLLKNNIKNATDFEVILQLHVEFLTSLLSKCFITDVCNANENSDVLHRIPKINDTTNVYETVIEMLNLSDEFCNDALNWPAQLDDEHLHKLEQYSHLGNAILNRLRELVRDIFSSKQEAHLIKLGFHLKMIKL